MSHDTIIHHLIRPVVRVLAGTPVTPNQLTALRFGTGIAAAITVGQGRLAIGMIVFVLSALLDRADGELARQTGRLSPHGHRYDLLADWSADAMLFICLGIGARHGPLGRSALALGVVAAAGVSALFWSINTRRTPDLPRYIAASGRVLVDPDDAVFIIPVLLWCFGASAVLLSAAVSTPLLAVWMVLGERTSLRKPSQRPVSQARCASPVAGADLEEQRLALGQMPSQSTGKHSW